MGNSRGGRLPRCLAVRSDHRVSNAPAELDTAAQWPDVGVGVLRDVSRQHSAKMLLPKEQDPVEAFLASGANPSFFISIGVGCPHWRLDKRHSLRCENRLEAHRKLGVTTADQEAHGQRAVLELPTELPRLLSHPRTGRVGRAAGQMNASTAEFHEEQNIECLQPCGFDR